MPRQITQKARSKSKEVQTLFVEGGLYIAHWQEPLPSVLLASDNLTAPDDVSCLSQDDEHLLLGCFA
jgi:hypothetical protein